MKLKNATSSPCKSQAYAGRWTTNDSGQAECAELLSGEVASDIIKVEGILDRDLNMIGLAMSYTGSPSGEYLLIHMYCDHDRTELGWDGSYTTHSSGSVPYY